jgi:hypothetical protein
VRLRAYAIIDHDEFALVRKDQSIQKVLSDYEKLQIPIPELKGTTMTDHQLWDLDTFDSKIMEAI